MNNTEFVPLDEARRRAESGSSAWHDMKELPKLRANTPGLDDSLLPEALRGWLGDVSERTQVPLECVAAPAIVALSSVIGRTIGIKPARRNDWLVVPNLWGGVIGRPGMMKSPAIREALRPLSRLAAEAQDEFKTNSARSGADKVMNEAEQATLKNAARKAAESGDNVERERIARDLTRLIEESDGLDCHERRYMTNDPTVEKLGELLNQNPRGLLVVRDELGGWLRSLAKQGREGDREFYLEGWDGSGSFTVDRMGRGTLNIQAHCVSIMGGIQPAKLQAYVDAALSGDSGDDGLLQRFQLLVWPDGLREWKNVDRFPDHEALDRAFEIFARLDCLGETTDRLPDGQDDIPSLRFSDDAQELFNDWRNGLETRLRSKELEACPAFEFQLAKYRSLMPSLALVFALAGSDELPGAVELEAAQLAASWVEFLEHHHRKLYASEVNPDLAAAWRLHEKIATGSITDGMSVREVYRRCWSGLSTPAHVNGGLHRLAECGIARIEEEDTGGRPSETIHIHPRMLGVAA